MSEHSRCALKADSLPQWLRPVWPFLELAWGMQVSELLRKHGELALGYITQVRSP